MCKGPCNSVTSQQKAVNIRSYGGFFGSKPIEHSMVSNIYTHRRMTRTLVFDSISRPKGVAPQLFAFLLFLICFPFHHLSPAQALKQETNSLWESKSPDSGAECDGGRATHRMAPSRREAGAEAPSARSFLWGFHPPANRCWKA